MTHDPIYWESPARGQLWVWSRRASGPAPSTSGQSTPIRIGDAERDRAVAALGDHFAAGRLTKRSSTSAPTRRWAHASTATSTPLFADLPRTAPSEPDPRPTRRPPMFSPLMWLLPMLVVVAVVTAVVLTAPWILWGFVWVFLFGGLWGRHRHRHHGGHHRYR